MHAAIAERYSVVEVIHSPLRLVLVSVAVLVGWLLWGHASVLTAADLYGDTVKPLLQQRCWACHGALKQAAGLRLDTAELIRRGGDSGPILQADDIQRSELLLRVKSPQADIRMPPEGQPLTREEIAALEQWIASGSKGPEREQPQADPLQHWAFQPPIRRVGPAGSAAHPIDAWLDASAKALGVQPYPPASKRVWLRRVFLDLVGLPPTPAEMEDYLEDQSVSAVDRVVDALLNRPEYGQRWARHWMDVWRYSDWYGRRAVPDVMNSYPQIWRWRDWIVDSLNEDKGYDRMILEMLAADELVPADDRNVVATGFLVRNWFKWNYETWMKDNVEHTARAFLGLTLQCAMCHDHKYDPISHEDYFRFRAFFEPLELRHDRVPGEADPGPFKKYEYAKSYGPIQSGAIRVFDEKLNAETFMFRGGDARNRIDGRPAVEPGPPRALTPGDFSISPITLPAPAAYPGLKDFLRDEETQKCQAALSAARAAKTKAEQEHQISQQHWQQLASRFNQPISSSNPTDHDALSSAEYERLTTRAALRSAELAVELAEDRLVSLRARMAADDAQVAKLSDAETHAKHACRSEKLVAFEEAQLHRAQQEAAVLAAEHALASTGPEKQPAAKTVLDEAQKKLVAARESEDRARGQLNQVDKNYTPLSPKYPETSTGRRLALARWIASEKNPLTARIAVNHMWLRHFGQPLVESVDNFGHQGKLPTQPELLDWLAVELMSHNWSMKHVHRLIVTSAAYRRSSSLVPGQFEATDQLALHANRLRDNEMRDRDNVSLWRFPTRRMEAEVVRDSVLAVSGELDSRLRGHELELSEWIASRRRSMYFTQHGEQQMQFLQTFDGANAGECYRRSSTVLPAQALALSNSELVVHFSRLAAQAFAQRLTEKTGDGADDALFAQAAFQAVLSRPPSTSEQQDSLDFLKEQRSMLAAMQSQNGPVEPAGGAVAVPQSPAQDAGQRARENLVMALFNHTDFVTIR